ncbi:MAG: MurR/RpiR family transcriptional regulator [Gammaproteobacteria bacterium]|nr:MurR/RpiR family transcriptional regulator [Gammaproteobacteria bacterium]
MDSNKTSIAKIKEHLVEGYNNYPKEVQKAAKYLISNTFEIPVYSLRKISKKAEVSPSTLIRLVRMLGFERYDDFKTVYIEEAKNSVSHFTLNAQKIQKQKTDKSFVKFEKFALKAIDSTLNDEIYDKIDPLINLILGAKNIYIVGMRSTFSLAFYLHYLLHMMLPNVVLIRDQEGMLMSEITHMNNQDLVFVFGITPLSRSSIFTIKQIVTKDPKTVVLTDEIIANIVPNATQLVSLGNNSQTFIPSFIPFITFSELLVSKLIAKGDKRILSYIKKTELELSEVGIFKKSE